MEPSDFGTFSTARLKPTGTVSMSFGSDSPQLASASTWSPGELREKVGEFVGQIFYGTLLRQMQESKLKGEYFHGGRGEEVFKAQLGMELARRMGRAPDDPIAGKLYEALQRQRRSDKAAFERVTEPSIGKRGGEAA